MKKSFPYIFVLLVLVACQAGMQPTGTETIASTLIDSQTPINTRAFTFTPESSVTQKPTSTWTFTFTPEITATLATTRIQDLPPWLRNPEQNVLMYRLWDGSYPIVQGGDHILPAIFFYNPDTGERYEMEGPYDKFFTSIRWYDNQHVVIQAESGILQVVELTEGWLASISEDHPAYSEFRPTIFFEPEDQIEYGVDSGTGNYTITVVEYDTGSRAIFDIGSVIAYNVILSGDREFLAVLSGISNEMIWGSHIDLFDYETRSLILSIDDTDINAINFYPDDSRMVYMRGRMMPCILDLTSMEINCLDQIHNAYPGQGIYFRGFTGDRQSLMFLHSFISQGTGEGGLCFYKLIGGSMTCPLDGLDILVDRAITDFVLSPDEQYIAAVYEEVPPEMDFGEPLGLLVAERDGGMPTDLGIPIQGHPLLEYTVFWRPIP